MAIDCAWRHHTNGSAGDCPPLPYYLVPLHARARANSELSRHVGPPLFDVPQVLEANMKHKEEVAKMKLKRRDTRRGSCGTVLAAAGHSAALFAQSKALV